MTGIRLLSSDLDGTLVSFSGDHSASRRFADMWRSLPEDERPLLCFNSGRLVADLRAAAAEAGLPAPDFLVGGVGTTIVDRDGRVLHEYQHQFRDGWERSLVTEVLEATPGVQPQPERYQSPFKSSWYLLNASEQDLLDLRQRLAQVELDVTVVYSSARDLDVLPARADKGNAVRYLCQHLGISANQVVVAGDTGNDASMFAVHGINGILVGNAKAELVQAAAGCEPFAARELEADGVIEGLVHYGVCQRD